MKRILLPAALLLCAAACAPAPTENANANANMNTNMSNMNAANANATSSTNADADIIAREKQVYDTIKRKDAAAFGAFLADDFIYVNSGKAGFSDKAATVKEATSSGLSDVTLSDFKILHIDQDAVAVAYNSDSTGTQDGKTTSSKERESSVWVNRGGKWVVIFHQDCEIRPMTPPPGASANANTNTNAAANTNKATTTASPATATTTTADAEANEKLVWDAIKRHDAEAFGNFLAPDAIELEPDKVYNKAESVSTVTSLPFLSTVTLSDFKTVKIDDDASIVTYTVKGTGPDKKPFTEHHSTVWSNHGGKWLAVLHHGTPVGPPPPPTPGK